MKNFYFPQLFKRIVNSFDTLIQIQPFKIDFDRVSTRYLLQLKHGNSKVYANYVLFLVINVNSN